MPELLVEHAFPIGLAVLAYVTVQRLLELVLAARNTRRLIAEGGLEVGRGHYGAIVALHAIWLVVIWLFGPGRPILLAPLVLLAVVQVLRFWTLASIGRRWTTRIIVKPGEALVATGPYRFLSHPNYLVVVCEIFLLPAVFGLFGVAILFSLLNAAVLMIRIPAEAAALRQHQG